ncbi:MAG: methionyl-tRNA formyltransferase [Patescibacteria group bacterium]
MSNTPYSVIFMGTPEFSVPTLEALIKSEDFSVTAVVTQEDKPIGRTQTLSAPAVKVCAEKNNIPVFQPKKVREIFTEIEKLAPDLIVVLAYGQIIPQNILDIPKFGCINIHASLLPKYRGAACLQAAILNGDQETGLTIMKMEAGLDTGPILKQFAISLNGQENIGELHDQASLLAGQVVCQSLKDYCEDKLPEQIQDDALATYVRTIKKEDGHLDFQKSALELERQIRAFNPWPGSFALTEDNKMIKIGTVSKEITSEARHVPGELFLEEKSLLVATTKGALKIESLQLAGGKFLKAGEFLAGHKDFVGKVLK